jgi:hypothetical protein
MDDGDFERGIQLLLGEGSKNLDAPIADLHDGFASFPFSIPHFNAVESLDVHLSNLVGDGVISVSSKPGNTGPQEKMCACIVGR